MRFHAKAFVVLFVFPAVAWAAEGGDRAATAPDVLTVLDELLRDSPRVFAIGDRLIIGGAPTIGIVVSRNGKLRVGRPALRQRGGFRKLLEYHGLLTCTGRQEDGPPANHAETALVGASVDSASAQSPPPEPKQRQRSPEVAGLLVALERLVDWRRTPSVGFQPTVSRPAIEIVGGGVVVTVQADGRIVVSQSTTPGFAERPRASASAEATPRCFAVRKQALRALQSAKGGARLNPTAAPIRRAPSQSPVFWEPQAGP